MDKHTTQAQVSQAETICEVEVDVEDAFGEHDVLYWVREGNRLVPANPTQIAAIQEYEMRLRLAVWRSNSSTSPLCISQLRHVGLSIHRWLLHPLARLRKSRSPGLRDTLPTDTQFIPSLTETQQDAAQKRAL